MMYVLSDEQIENLEMNLIDLVVKDQKRFHCDLIIDIHFLERKNREGELPNKMYFVVRENGCLIGDANNQSIQYYKGDGDRNKWYEIYIEKLFDTDISKISHYTRLRDIKSNCCCIREMREDEIGGI